MVLLAVLDYLTASRCSNGRPRPRYHHQYLPDVIEYEPDVFPAASCAAWRCCASAISCRHQRHGNQQVLAVAQGQRPG